jgi:hypothetical protein
MFGVTSHGYYYPAPIWWLDLGFAVLLIAIIWRRKSAFPLLGIAAYGLHWGFLLSADCAPSRGGIATIALAGGFVLLFLGVAINWLYYRHQTRAHIGGAPSE